MLNLKYCGKYILYMVFISCIALLSINLTNSDSKRSENKPSRIIIKSIEKEYVPDNKEHTENGGIRASTPVTNGKSGVQPLPIPDANSPIIFSPLS